MRLSVIRRRDTYIYLEAGNCWLSHSRPCKVDPLMKVRFSCGNALNTLPHSLPVWEEEGAGRGGSEVQTAPFITSEHAGDS